MGVGRVGRVTGRVGRLGGLADDPRDPVLTTVCEPWRLELPFDFGGDTRGGAECDLWRDPESLLERVCESCLWRELDE